MGDIDLSGVFPPICTPFTSAGELDIPNLHFNLRRYLTQPLRGIVVLGSNGEAVYLTSEEKITLIKETVRIIKGEGKEKKMLVIAGTGGQSTKETITNTKAAAEAGADIALVISPGFFSLSPEALETHYREVADASPIPVLLYNVPKFSGVDIPADVSIRCASHRNIIGLKDSGGNITNISRVIHETKGKNFQVLAGSASFLLPSLVMGAVGGVCALANVAASQCAEVVSLYKQGDLKKAVEAQGNLIPPNSALTATFGVAGIKHALSRTGFYGGPVRSPLKNLTQTDKTKLDDILVKYNIIPKSKL